MNTTASLAPLAVTLGDPAGIGPEISLRAAVQPNAPPCVLIGTAAAAIRARDLVAPDWKIELIDGPESAVQRHGVIQLIASGESEPHPYSEVSAIAGKTAYDAVMMAISMAKAGRVSGIVTAPIHKRALAEAGYNFPGHTEILEEHGGVKERGGRVAMMLANEDLRVVLVTIHIALSEVPAAADKAAQLRAIRLAHQGCQDFGIGAPRVAVAGLNPHAGEEGLFGREEIEVIRPAIEEARAEGIDVTGPYSGDTVFMAARKGAFDVVVAQYHDQGLIPIKYMGLERGVNVTLGLPFVRTSPDHGTAFDIAGRGVADPSSMSYSMEMAWRMVQARQPALAS